MQVTGAVERLTSVPDLVAFAYETLPLSQKHTPDD